MVTNATKLPKAGSPRGRFRVCPGTPIPQRRTSTTKMAYSLATNSRTPPIGPPDADVTLVGWGSTKGVIREAVAILNEEGISTNQLQIRWLVPLHGKAILNILELSKYTIIVENNYSGQFARYLRSETSYVPNGYIRKYDGEPFMPHHIVEAVKEQLASKTHETQLSVPVHEILV